MNHFNVALLLLLNTLCIQGMNNYQEAINSLNKIPEKPKSQPIPIPTGSVATQKENPGTRILQIEISPSSHLWLLGNHSSNSPGKRSPGTSLR